MVVRTRHTAGSRHVQGPTKKALTTRGRPKRKRGRPTKAQAQQRDFGWAKKYQKPKPAPPPTMLPPQTPVMRRRPQPTVTPASLRGRVVPRNQRPAPPARPSPRAPQTKASIKKQILTQRKQYPVAKPFAPLQVGWQGQAQKAIWLGKQLRSSFIVYLDYDPISFEARVMWKRGGGMVYHGVPPHIFQNWYIGMASCKTTDGKLRWWIGKTPSLGAFYNQKIKGQYPGVKI